MHLIAQTYYNGTTTTAGQGAALAVFFLIFAGITIIYVASMWKIFTKAGEPGWYAIVPILNVITLLKIAGRPWWWILLAFIPFAGWIVLIIVGVDLAAAFGKGAGFGVGLAILGFIFYPILAFGDATYQRAGGYGDGNPYGAPYGQSYPPQPGYPQPGYPPQGYPQPGAPAQPAPGWGAPPAPTPGWGQPAPPPPPSPEQPPGWGQ